MLTLAHNVLPKEASWLWATYLPGPIDWQLGAVRSQSNRRWLLTFLSVRSFLVLAITVFAAVNKQQRFSAK